MQVFEQIDQNWNFHDIPASRERFEQALNAKNLDLDSRLQLQTQLARTYSIERNFAKAHELLDAVEKELSEATTFAKIRYYLERGRTFNSARDKNSATPLFKEAFHNANISKCDFLAIDAAHMLAIAESTAEEQLKWNFTALKLAEDSQEPRARNWLGSLYNNIGWSLHDQKKFGEALDLFQKALQFRIQKEKVKEITIAKWCVARCLRSLERYPEALRLQLDLEQELDLRGDPDGYVYEELCELNLILDQPEKVQVYAQKAFAFFSKDSWLLANDSERLDRLKQLAKG